MSMHLIGPKPGKLGAACSRDRGGQLNMRRSNTAGTAPAVAICNPKYARNIAGALRACACYGIRQLWWSGDRVTLDVAKGQRLPREERMKGYRNVEMVRDEGESASLEVLAHGVGFRGPRRYVCARRPCVLSGLADPGIVRNRLKVLSVIRNAQAFLEVQDAFGQL
jgi:hypothetical protein